MLPIPWMPRPMQPIVTLFPGVVTPFLPRTEDGTICGKAAAPPLLPCASEMAAGEKGISSLSSWNLLLSCLVILSPFF